MKRLGIVLALLISANLAHGAPPERHRVNLSASAGLGLRQTRGGFDAGHYGGYALGLPAAGGLEAELLFAGRHGPLVRGSAIYDVPINSVAPEHFKLLVLDVGWSYRVPLVQRDEVTLSLTPSAGFSYAHADAVWDDGLHFLLPCPVTLDPAVYASCRRARDDERATGRRFDHAAAGGFVSATLAFELKQFRFGAAVDQRLLAAVGEAPSLIHHITTVRAFGGVAFDL